jgi:hypothetical protein
MAVSPRVRTAWIVGGSVFTVATLAFGTVQAVGALAHEERMVHTVIDEPVRTIDIEADGSVTVHGTDTERVTVAERVSDGLQHPDRSSRVVGDRLVLRGTCGGFPQTFCGDTFTVTAPRSVRVVVRGEGVTVTDVRGGADITSDGDNISVYNVAGPMRLRSHGGNIDTGAISAARVDAESSGGNTTLSFTTAPRLVDVSSHGGNIDIRLPNGSVAYRVDASAHGGSTDTAIRTDPSSPREIRAESSGGNVSIRYRS